MNAMLASDLPLPRIGRGKVRDIYAVGDDRVLLLTTDRISAFDVVMAEDQFDEGRGADPNQPRGGSASSKAWCRIT